MLVYVLRVAAGQPQVLVFTHRHAPEAGVQVPAGTVVPGEAAEAAAYRELLEETGLRLEQVRLVRRLASAQETAPELLRHVFLFEPRTGLPKAWSQIVAGDGEDAGMVFDFYWLPATPALRLAGAQERYLHLAGAWGETEQ